MRPGSQIFAALACIVLVACHARRSPVSLASESGEGEMSIEAPADTTVRACNANRQADSSAVKLFAGCSVVRAEVSGWGPVPRETTPAARCPIQVSIARAEPGEGRSGQGESKATRVIADPLSADNAFAELPWNECIPPEYLLGSRRILNVEGGWIVAYTGHFSGQVEWRGHDFTAKRSISGARLAGLTKSPSGTILALAIGRARLGRGGVLAFDPDLRDGELGVYRPRLVATLPLEPSPVAFAEEGRLVGFAQRFLFRVAESGLVENLHYLSRDVGRVVSITKDERGRYYLGLECGILRLVPEPGGGGTFREEWWSASSGASGRWTPCPSD